MKRWRLRSTRLVATLFLVATEAVALLQSPLLAECSSDPVKSGAAQGGNSCPGSAPAWVPQQPQKQGVTKSKVTEWPGQLRPGCEKNEERRPGGGANCL